MHVLFVCANVFMQLVIFLELLTFLDLRASMFYCLAIMSDIFFPVYKFDHMTDWKTRSLLPGDSLPVDGRNQREDCVLATSQKSV